MKFQTSLMTLAVALACASGAAFAADTQPATTPASSQQAPETVADILAQHGLRERLERRSGEYAHFDDAAVRKMEQAQDRVFAMLSGVNSLDQLNPTQKVELSNALDEVKAVLTDNENNRLVCHIERKIGSNMMQRRCETVADREAHARASAQEMRDRMRSYQTTNGN
jgi:hypothetical protein